MPSGHNSEFMAKMRKIRWDRDAADPIGNFWKKIERGSDDQCWFWKSRTVAIYPRTSIDRWKTVTMAHRIAWVITHGPIPDGLFVLHKCDNPKCCNPNHLFLGTIQDNVDDMINKGRHRYGVGDTAPWKGKFGSAHNTSKLTEDQVRNIRKEYVPFAVSLPKLARKYNVSQGCIRAILKRRVWNHI